MQIATAMTKSTQAPLDIPPLLSPHYFTTSTSYHSHSFDTINPIPPLIKPTTMFARRIASNIPRVRAQASLFHSTAPAFVQKGDAIPNLDVLVENSPGNKVNLAKEIKNKAVIIGTPAAFST